ncbi:MAG TPA: hypothetical protein VJT49_25245 [Amycolatopsis sp.]|uniref:hypothetical protein n=1 Tax=Amycolatopsis sp. TaxID=37632 RepID=UPI002B4A1254|nr:hypothetical protein [Amycolatopsis sp.]HKS48356.1 hypothetical protein [Amycolatopsis sp.]
MLCTDVDEIVAPDPRGGDPGDYIDRFTGDYVTCTGYEILHQRDTEPPLDLARPVLDQRSTWFPNPLYSKPLPARVPMAWRGGFHERVDGQRRSEPSLYLIHLHRGDYEICLNRHRTRLIHRWAQDDIDNHRGYQNRIVEPEKFHHWLYRDRCNGDPVHPEPVPDHWRSLL